MLNKSALKATIDDVLEENDIQDGALAEDLLDRISQDFAEEVYDDTDEEEEAG
jgi:hypothetical protein